MEIDKRILQTVFKAIDEINQQLPEKQRLNKSIDTPLFGGLGKLDSLGLVNLIVATEEKIEKEFGVAITLTNKGIMSQGYNSFKSIGAFIDSIGSLLKEKMGG